MEEDLEALFYVSGWTVHALSKSSKCRSEKFGISLCKLVKNVTLDNNNISGKCEFPNSKVDRISHFGGLRYSPKDYFSFIQTIE